MISGSRITYPRFKAALQAQDLRFILGHLEGIEMELHDEIEVCNLIAEQSPDHMEPTSAQWLADFARKVADLSQKAGVTQ